MKIKQLIKPFEQFYSTNLFMNMLNPDDAGFVRDLLNTQGWLKYIGNRNIYDYKDAINYIEKITNDENTCYWTVSLKSTQEKIGFITLIKRIDNEFVDVGFAFLPHMIGKGYAYEATNELIKRIKELKAISTLTAITLPENENSIKLLLKLGFNYKKTHTSTSEILHVYHLNLQ